MASYHDPVQVYITEHQTHTNGNWNALSSNSDVNFEASMLANQIQWIASQGVNGFVFKADFSPSANGGVTKSGIMTAENSIAPYAVGDLTLSGVAVSMVSKHLAGGKPLLTCALNATTYQGGFGRCIVARDPTMVHVILINNAPQNTAAADQTVDVMGQDMDAVFNWAGLGVSNSSYAILHELSDAGFKGEISAVVPTSALTLSRFLPAFAVARLAIPVNAQTLREIAATNDMYVAGGAAITSNFGAAATLKVGTSNTSDHSTTYVTVVRFPLQGYTDVLERIRV